jgi:YidC/Oxa1 family membrane protein insertase
MDRKSIPAVIIVVLLTWVGMKLVDHAFPPRQVPVSTNEVVSLTNVTVTSTNQSLPGNVSVSGGPANFTINTNIPEQLLVISNQKARYTFTSRGGGLQFVELLDYPQAVSSVRSKSKGNTGVATLNTFDAPPVLASVGDPSLSGDNNFTLLPIPNGVRAQKTLSNGLTVTKDFVLGSNYLIKATIDIKNNSGTAVILSSPQWVVGTATPMSPQDSGFADSVMWYNGAKSGSVPQPYFATNTTKLGIFPRTPMTEFNSGSNSIQWVSAQNQFFSLATMFEPGVLPTNVLVRMIFLTPPSDEEIAASSRTVIHPQGLEAVIQYPSGPIPPGQETTLGFNIFAGPKVYRMLAGLADQFGNRIDLVMGFGIWGVISKGLLAMMNWLYYHVSVPYGFSIVLITVLIRTAIWPLTRASTRSMKRMQELQPQIKALQEKFKDDPQKLQQKTWEFYRKNKVNPLGGCLPMLLQIPLIFGFYGVLRNAIELRGAHFLWIGDLSQPDTIFSLPLLGHNFPINPMPLIMGVTQIWQASITPVSPGMDPAQQKMMRYMPLLMVYFFYNYSSGLALYWTVSNLITILQNKLTKTQPAGTAALVPAAAPAKRK